MNNNYVFVVVVVTVVMVVDWAITETANPIVVYPSHTSTHARLLTIVTSVAYIDSQSIGILCMADDGVAATATSIPRTVTITGMYKVGDACVRA